MQTTAKQCYEPSLDARSLPGFTGPTPAIEPLSSDSIVLLALMFGAVIKVGRIGWLGRWERES